MCSDNHPSCQVQVMPQHAPCPFLYPGPFRDTTRAHCTVPHVPSPPHSPPKTDLQQQASGELCGAPVFGANNGGNTATVAEGGGSMNISNNSSAVTSCHAHRNDKPMLWLPNGCTPNDDSAADLITNNPVCDQMDSCAPTCPFLSIPSPAF